jgi:SAM-dependent methyltransferase
MEPLSDLPRHASENRAYWNGMADGWVAAGERSWRQDEPTWGTWAVSERELEMLPRDMRGMRAVELGCGTAYVSAWMARRGAEVTGIDVSERQLETARRLADEHGVALTLLHGSAEATPFPDETFDFAISEYGAAIWCDPDVWIPEAHRILKAGGRLVFLGNHPLAHVCAPLDGSRVTERLERPYFGMRVLDWTAVDVDPGGIEFCLGHVTGTRCSDASDSSSRTTASRAPTRGRRTIRSRPRGVGAALAERAGVEAAQDQRGRGDAMTLDHLILAGPELEPLEALVRERTGVVPVRGGRHLGHGTHNALVGLGAGHYLELLAVDPAQGGGPFAATIAHLRSPALHTWCALAGDAATVAERARALGLTPAGNGCSAGDPTGACWCGSSSSSTVTHTGRWCRSSSIGTSRSTPRRRFHGGCRWRRWR